jgi:PTH1 family peptidyl-tRNA hydrolase
MIFGNGNEQDPPDTSGGHWLVAGLGNPGQEYARTRHNLGFMVVDVLAERFGSHVKRSECRSFVGRAEIGGKTVELIKPQTFMNLSGEALVCLLRKEERSLRNALVIVDDLALPFGTIRLRERGSAGGHNGLKSIISSTGSQEFARLRIGIQPEHPVSNTKKFVLDNFSSGDGETLRDVLERSADAVEVVVADGFASAMSRFNG